MSGKRTPEIRFKGFEDKWEQYLAKEIFKTVVDKGYPQLPVLSASQERGMIKREENGINIQYNTQSVVGYKRVQPGQFVIHLRSFQGGFAHSTIDGITSPAYTVMRFQEKEKHYDYFWRYILNSEIFIRTLELITYGIRDGRSISFEDFSTLEFCCPTYDEQKQIGGHFQNLDSIISLQQTKLEKLKILKKSMLEKMFPKCDETVPEIRFAGFSGEWKKQKLGEICERVIRKNKNLESELPLTISAQYGLVDQRMFFKRQIASKDVSNYFLIKKGEFAYNKSYSDGYPFGAVKRLERYDLGVLSTLYIVFAPNNEIINSDYLSSYYDTNNWHKQVAERAAEGARNHGLLNISSDAFFDTELAFPKKTEEQERIGLYFRELDRLVILHQHKLEKLKNIKSACLEKMFV